ncbi:MAG: VOC family protein [Alphaproteobacteria bacterium]|nr:VOC family protein [Alphaproteobacteria bacterium]
MSTGVDCLDHIGIATPDLAATASAYERLGFRLAPLAQQAGPLTPGGAVTRWGSGNRCIMLRRGYVELIGVVEPGLYDNGLGAFLARYAGIHILAFGVADAAAQLPRLREAGLDVIAIRPMQRPAATPSGEGLARFKRIPLADAPEGRIQLIEHETPELLWQDHLLDHANRAVGLSETVLCVADLEAALGRFSRLTGIEPTRQGSAGILSLASGRLVLCAAAEIGRFVPGAVPPLLPWFAGFTVATEDGNRAARPFWRGTACHSPSTTAA